MAIVVIVLLIVVGVYLRGPYWKIYTGPARRGRRCRECFRRDGKDEIVRSRGILDGWWRCRSCSLRWSRSLCGAKLFHRWRPIQKTFRSHLQKYAGVEKADAVSDSASSRSGSANPGRRSLCHLPSGLRLGSRAARHSRRAAHSASELPYMDKHPFQQFGCTPCHGGQGWATDGGRRARRQGHGTIRCSRRASRSATD